jgi:quercetin dioxygenase-like cupin family protein
MIRRNKYPILQIILLSSVLASNGLCGDSTKTPVAKVIPLTIGDKDYLRILDGPPDAVEMHSGIVNLKPNTSVGKHNTEDYEELVIVLEGKGEMRISGGDILKIEKNVALYCPPHREHDIYNTGPVQLKYIYVVAKTK